MSEMQTYHSGASRSDATNKLSYLRGLSVQVLTRYMEYLQANRALPDGSLRDFDNWKKGQPAARYKDSLYRHTHDAIRKSIGLSVPEDASLEDLLCAVIFNASGWLFELLVAKSGNREEETKCGS